MLAVHGRGSCVVPRSRSRRWPSPPWRSPARADAYVYWAELPPPRVFTTFGGLYRANLDGTGNQLLSEAGFNPYGVAVDNAHLYWAGPPGNIARANLDGTGADPSFITGLNSPGSFIYGVAVDGAHVYWTSADTDTIGRANLDGTGVNQSFIARGQRAGRGGGRRRPRVLGEL